jgi:DNA-directed RNA polymerase specialized sigma24 family protein
MQLMAADEGPEHPHRDLPITEYLQALKAGDADSLNDILNAYWCQLVTHCDARLSRQLKTQQEGQDFAIQAFQNLAEGIKRGRWPRLENRTDLWQVLLQAANCRIRDFVRQQMATKRGGQLQRLGTGPNSPATGLVDLDQFPARDAFAADAEQLVQLMLELSHRLRGMTTHVRILVDHLNNYTNQEIAIRHEISSRTVRRKLDEVLEILREELS